MAVLGLEGTIGARRLARVLLADPLGEEAEWEKVLLDFGDSDGRALLLRYLQCYRDRWLKLIERQVRQAYEY